MKILWFALALLVALFAATCAVDISGAPCQSDENCPEGQYCGTDNACHVGAGEGPAGDAGEGHADGGGALDAGRDGGQAWDTGHADAGDAGHPGDTGHDDGGPDAGHPDAGDAGDAGDGDTGHDDAGGDAGTDGGTPECDGQRPCASGVCCGGVCFAGECCADDECVAVGKPTCTASHVCSAACIDKVTECGKGYVCCGAACRVGDCCDSPDCAGNPHGDLCINYLCSKLCKVDGDCLPGKCCTAGPAKGSCYEGGCCDDSQCTAPETCGGGGVTGMCGCTASSPAEFCEAQNSSCGDTTGKDNCGADRSEPCGKCPNPVNDCRTECITHACAPLAHSTTGCDPISGDVYWIDSCGATTDLKQDCTVSQVCKAGACCTPKDKTAACGSNVCGTAPDGCGGTISCGTCTTCASECVTGQCKPKGQVGSKCDPATGDVYWYDSCDAKQTLKEDCVAPKVCFNAACCTPAMSGTLCTSGKCGLIDAGCGVQVDCGGCTGGYTCDTTTHACSTCASGKTCSGVCCASGTQVCNPQNQCCTRNSEATTCAGKCGTVKDNCGVDTTCGGCTNGETCTSNACTCTSAVRCGAGNACCAAGEVCNGTSGLCCTRTPQSTACAGKCGTVSDGCGGHYTCDACTNGYTCVSNGCQCSSGKICSGQCCTSGQTCNTSSQCCTPTPQATACQGKCGTVSDGCGGTYTCGGCTGCTSACVGNLCKAVSHDHSACDAGDVYWFDSCNVKQELKTDCTAGQVCASGSCCTPDTDAQICLGKGWDCGGGTVTDNCGQQRNVTCAACQSPLQCDGNNKCICNNQTCAGQCCGAPTEICHQTLGTCCARLDRATECSDRQCGLVGDGCGGYYSCGNGCGAGYRCSTGYCVCDTGVECAGACCGSSEVCYGGNPTGGCCLPEDEQTICMNNGWECGNHSVLDNCNISRDVFCGICANFSGTGNRCCITMGMCVPIGDPCP